MCDVWGTPFPEVTIQTFDEVGKFVWNDWVYRTPVFLIP